MKHPSVEVQRLLEHTRGLDEPTVADRERIRMRLDASWASSATAPRAARLGAKLWFTRTSIVALAGIGIWLARAPEQPRGADHAAPRVVPAASVMQPTAAPPPLASPQELPGTAATSKPPAPPRARIVSRAPQPAAKRASVKTRPLDPQAAPAQLPAASVQQLSAQTVQPKSSSQEPQPLTRSSAAAPAIKGTTRLVEARPEPFTPDAIADEVSLLGAAQTELRAGQPARALNYIRQHAFRFPAGALSQERLAVHVLALCAMNRKSAARQVFEDLQRRAPSAAVLARIRHDCEL